MPFSAFGLHADILRGVKELGFTRPTPIQSDAIPHALQGRDLLACAQTGSGKTAAFLLPIIHRLMGRKRGTTRALVLTPTRELAAQIAADLQELATHTPIRGAAVFGGVGMGPQEHAFRTGVDVLVATPGRLLDHLKHPYAKLDALEILVLDEADRMLDMGFLPDIKRILRHLPEKRQTLFFSATMQPPIVALTREMLHNPAAINVERQGAPAAGITQAVYPVKQVLKAPLLLALLKREDVESMLVFTRTKHRANRLADWLDKQGISVERIHGNRSQAQRTKALAGFKDGTYQVLVATDIAARGIDVASLGHVINFDVPAAPEDYVHRIGRTGRAEATGEAFTFVSPEEENDLRDIEKAVGKRLPRVTIPDFDYAATSAPPSAAPLRPRPAAKPVAKPARPAHPKPAHGRPARSKSSSAKPVSGRAATPRHEAPKHTSNRPAASTTPAPKFNSPKPPRRPDAPMRTALRTAHGKPAEERAPVAPKPQPKFARGERPTHLGKGPLPPRRHVARPDAPSASPYADDESRPGRGGRRRRRPRR